MKSLNESRLSFDQLQFYDREGYLVLPNLLDDRDLAPARDAMIEKVDRIADDLYAAGLVSDKLEGRPFAVRLAELFAGLTEQDFLTYGRSWRDRLPGYFVLMSNPKILDVVDSLIGGEIFANPIYNVRRSMCPGVCARGGVTFDSDSPALGPHIGRNSC